MLLLLFPPQLPLAEDWVAVDGVEVAAAAAATAAATADGVDVAVVAAVDVAAAALLTPDNAAWPE